ncbi:ABC transporter permease [Actinomyces sp. B33]|uniref:ABC transporter permease n=1 Tax=Actinomyces sp. B33 TaxID=2942131 RepID=UPI0023406A79|nr:ABC transporter permease [Actinomyces sp. B33]MDC4232654.1 ABC transporter permease [Actinomyces sp. B33]
MNPTSPVDERARRLAAEPMRELGQKAGVVAGTKKSIVDVWRRRELLGLLINREIKAKYKDSSFGFAWSMVKPLAQLLIYFIVIGHFLGAARGIPDFAIFVFAGLTAWGLVLEIVNGGTGSIVANAGLVKKVYLPREVFPLATAGTAVVNSAIQFAILVFAVVVTGRIPSPSLLGYLPLAIAILIVYGLTAALALSALNVYMRDIQHLVEVATFLAFWASPIVYSYEYVAQAVSGWLLEIYLANPVTLAILGFQRSLWAAGAAEPYPSHMLLRMCASLVVGLVCLFAAHRVFIRLEGNFAQEL